MTMYSLIAAMDEQGGIGYNNQLLCHLPADLKHFKAVTMGKPIVMGRKTYESIGKALPGRVNIVLSHSLNPIEGVIVLNSIEHVIVQTSSYPEVMIIGGANIYQQTLDFANRLYLTKIHHQFEADAFFPEINLKLWSCSHSEFRKQDELNPYDMTFLTYERISL